MQCKSEFGMTVCNSMNIIEVSAGIICRGDKVMLAQRPPGSRHAGMWEFPGGKLEKGETPVKCLERELSEELDIDIVASDTVFVHEHVIDDADCLKLYFIECRIDGECEPSPAVGQGIVWSVPEDLLSYELLEPDRCAIQYLIDRRKKKNCLSW